MSNIMAIKDEMETYIQKCNLLELFPDKNRKLY